MKPKRRPEPFDTRLSAAQLAAIRAHLATAPPVYGRPSRAI